MPAGIIATIDDGFATLDFVDQSLKGPALESLLEIGGPGTIETITRDGPRRKYRVPVGNAEAADLIDGDEPGAVWSAGQDTGAAAALVAADPNVNVGPDHANWHTPVDQYTSANKYVGTVDNDTVLHDRGQVYTGDATSFGGEAQAPTSADLLSYIDQYERDNPKSVPAPREIIPAAHISGALARQTAALGTDPGSHGVGTLEAPADPEGDVPGDEPTPDDSWTRAELNEYAADHGVEDADKLPNKAAVLEAIAKGAK